MKFVTTIDLGSLLDVDVSIEYDASVNEDFDPYEFWGQKGFNKTFEVEMVEVIDVITIHDALNDEGIEIPEGFSLPVTEEIKQLALEHAEENIHALY